ncbi:MAG: Ppx/GppA phosphatase family protein [Myxococcota bacterium]|nr:Ppx/GppA phosphatase family protein [Myxococcota bacterium]
MPERQIAGIDLGSNSFHMVLGQVGKHGGIRIIDRHKEYIRLAEGLDENNRLSQEAIDRGLECLRRFADRLTSVPKGQFRCVGTNTLRRARNGDDLLGPGTEILGQEIEVISGLEEARLIYRGVQLDNGQQGRRLVVDIGGGSTEVILGDLNGPQVMDSLHMGCVSTTTMFFPDGRLNRAGMEASALDVERKLAKLYQRFCSNFDFALGSSGTLNVLGRILSQSYGTHGVVTRSGLEALTKDLISCGTIEAYHHPEVSNDRRRVLPGGVAVLRGVMDCLRIDSIRPVSTALREGLMVDLVGRASGESPRATTIDRMQRRFEVDLPQAKRVQAMALKLFDCVAPVWFPEPGEQRRLLSDAARLHEVGLFMGFSGYQKHGAYLVANSDLPGFSRDRQRTLAGLILCHRGRFSESRLQRFRLGGAVDMRLALLLRVAVRLNRGRRDGDPFPLSVTAEGNGLTLCFSPGWLDAHNLTRADLEAEQRRCIEAGIELHLESQHDATDHEFP